jgi:serine/threonine protein kinase/Flp pilus assembly protein TadD
MAIAAGTKFGRYEVRRLLGAGGMGEVYLAHDAQLDRPIALKLLPTEFTKDETRLRRFQQEARATSALNHPYIITIFEIGETGAGAHFIATEFIEGENLRERITRVPLSLSSAIDITMQVTAALTAAHAAGIVHRDIKPENIMLRPDGYVKVLDFGLAKLTERHTASPNQQALAETSPGVVLGTVAYMSPEQARGSEVDARSDIFSLGIVFYEMVAGRSPFVGGSASDMIASIIAREPEPLARHLPGAPAELQRIVTKALEKERSERYQTIRELSEDLRRLKQRLEFETSEWDSPTAPLEMPPAALRQTLPYAEDRETVERDKGQQVTQPYLAETVPFASASHQAQTDASKPSPSSETATRITQERAPIDSLAVLPLANASTDAHAEYLSDGITESIINALAQLPHLRVMARSTVFRYKGKEVDPREVGRELGVRAVVVGRVLQLDEQLIIKTELVDTADGTQLWGEQYRRTPADIFAVQEEISKVISDKLRLKLTGAEEKLLQKRYTENTEAYQLYLKGRYHLAKLTGDSIKKGTVFFQQAIDLDPAYALAYAGLADAYYALSSAHMPPHEAMPKARAAAERALAIDDTLSEAHASLGLVKAFYDWDWAGAESEYRRAIELNPGHASAHHWYGWYLALMGRLPESIQEIKRAQELDPLSLEINSDLGLSFFLARHYDEAMRQFRKAMEMDESFIWGRFFMGWAYEQKGEFAAALAEFQKAAEQDDAPVIRAARAHALAISGHGDLAREALDELLLLQKQRHVSPYDLTIIYTGLGEKEKALNALEQAYESRSEALVWLKVDPRLDPLRTEARFIDLMRRVGFVA